MRIVVLGIGNPLVADDGVGIRVVARLRASLRDQRVGLVESQRGGLELLDHLEGWDRACIVDAAVTGTHPPGEVFRVTMQSPYRPVGFRSLHTLGLDAVLALGSIAGTTLPESVTMYAVEAADIESFGKPCTERVEAAIPVVTSRILSDLLESLPDCDIIHRERDGGDPWPPPGWPAEVARGPRSVTRNTIRGSTP
ncbi:MAG: hydrogenase maturation protease [Bacteroidota bacterium]